MRILLLAAVAVAGAATAGVVAHASASKTTIRVTEREYKIALSVRKVPEGTSRFQIRNTGHFAHALEIAGPGVKKRTPMIKPGTSAVLTVTLRAGSYSLWCPVPGHAALGMKSALIVTGTSTAGGASTGGDTTTGTSTDSGVPWG